MYLWGCCCCQVGRRKWGYLPNWYIVLLSGSDWISGCVRIADVVKGQPASISYSLWPCTYFGKGRMVNFCQRNQSLLLRLLSALPACLPLYLFYVWGLSVPRCFDSLSALADINYCSGKLLGVQRGGGVPAMTQAGPLLPWLVGSTLSGLSSFAGCGRGRLRELKLLASHFFFKILNSFMLAPNLSILLWKFKTF